MSKRLLLVLALVAAAPSSAWAWGASGHRIIGRLGIESLPPQVPAFVRKREVVDQVGELAREPDRAKDAGQPHDADLFPEHFVDIDDDGKVLGGPLITAMPRDRSDFETAMRAAGSNASKAGTLYYSMIDGWQRLAHDFALWRALKVGEKSGKTRRERAWFAADRRLREAIIIHDIGFWAHFVGDGSQPLHASSHYNGWGAYPNPKGFTNEKIHFPFESQFAPDHSSVDSVRPLMPAPAACAPPIQACVVRYLTATQAQTEPLYTLWGEGAFARADPRAVAFTNARIAAGAAMLRDLITQAWAASADGTVGYPSLKLKDVEASGQAPFENFYGKD
jgi:hypothetical protein